MTLKKKIFLTFVCIFIGFSLKSQDNFMFFNGNEINAKLLKIDSNKISYSENGTIKTINKNEVFRVTLQNGEKLLIKEETVYPPILYEDLIIFTDGSDIKVLILSTENENIRYLLDNKINNIKPSVVQFVKFKDGRTIKGVDLIKYEDKAILNNGDELNNIKYKDKNSTHFIIQEKGKSQQTELLFSDVFVIKLQNGEKKFPPIVEIKKDKKDSSNIKEIENKKPMENIEKPSIKQINKIIAKTKDTTENNLKRDYLFMKNGEIIEGEILSYLKSRILFLNYKKNDKEEYYLEDIKKYEVNIINYE